MLGRDKGETWHIFSGLEHFKMGDDSPGEAQRVIEGIVNHLETIPTPPPGFPNPVNKSATKSLDEGTQALGGARGTLAGMSREAKPFSQAQIDLAKAIPVRRLRDLDEASPESVEPEPRGEIEEPPRWANAAAQLAEWFPDSVGKGIVPKPRQRLAEELGDTSGLVIVGPGKVRSVGGEKPGFSWKRLLE